MDPTASNVQLLPSTLYAMIENLTIILKLGINPGNTSGPFPNSNVLSGFLPQSGGLLTTSNCTLSPALARLGLYDDGGDGFPQ